MKHNPNARLYLLLDVNVYIDNFKKYGRINDIVDLYQALPILSAVTNSQGKVLLLDSDHVLTVLQVKLVELLNYTEDEANNIANLIVSVSACDSSPWISKENGIATAEHIMETGKVNQRLLGEGRGLLDWEDMQILGAAHYPAACGSNLKTLIVTRDGAFHNIAAEMQPHGILVSHIREAQSLVNALHKTGN